MKKFVASVILITVIIISSSAQTTPFNLDNYKEFLEQNKDMTPADLLEMYPVGYFVDDIDLYYENALHFNNVYSKYRFTDDELKLLRKNGFVVSERLKKETFVDHFIEIYENDLPVFISTDAILHAFHSSYDAILKDVELNYLIDMLSTILNKMHRNISELDKKYDEKDMSTMLHDVDVYLTIPLLLLDKNVSPYYSSNSAEINKLLDLIGEESRESYKFFSDDCDRTIDFSQFKLRGHYTDDDRLANYFKAMMWLGKTELYLTAPDAKNQCDSNLLKRTVKRQIIDAVLISELIDLSGASSYYKEFEEVISFFVGNQDNVTYPNMSILLTELNIDDASTLLDDEVITEFQALLKTKPFSQQHILSQVLCSDPFSPTGVSAASAFMLFGQRFVIDSYITGNVVFDQILFDDTKQCRLYPSTLDILFALSNDASTHILIPELSAYNYSSNIAGLRYLVDEYDSDFWESSLYNLWLKAIKTLSSPKPNTRENYPTFMQTAAWGVEKMNTQLASWTELRHDNLLYAKQSYTSSGACEFPHGYVEPIPEFYKSMKRLAEVAAEKFKVLNDLTGNLDWLLVYFNHLYGVSDTLLSISEKELKGVDIDSEEQLFFQRLVSQEFGCAGVSLNGWYPNLYYNVSDAETFDLLVADYHTTPTNCSGISLGAVSHAGTGYVDLLLTIAELPNNKQVAFAGPVSSYHEYRSTNFLRLSDEEWKNSYFEQSFRPEWTNSYLADNDGNLNATSLKLASNLAELEKMLGGLYLPNFVSSTPSADVNSFNLSNYPNPFSANTVISYKIMNSNRSNLVKLSIIDIQGREINILVNKELQPGNYITGWNRKDNSGALVPPGIYMLKITVGKVTQIRKMVVSN